MIKIKGVISRLESFAPESLAEAWDKVGLQIGSPELPCQKIGLSLDVTPEVVTAAIAQKINLLVVHHPLIFQPLTEIRYDHSFGTMIQQLCAHQVSVYAMHTNLDSTVGGLNDWLAMQIGLSNQSPLCPPPDQAPQTLIKKGAGLGRIGTIQSTILKELASILRKKLSPQSLRVTGDLETMIERVALCTGSGSSLIPQAISKHAQVFITGDLKYHQALEARQQGLCLIDVGHYASEFCSIEILEKYLLEQNFPGLKIIPLDIYSDPLQGF